MKIKKKVPKIKNVIISYVSNNIKEYILITLLFIIGILVGVIIINNCDDSQNTEISNYITEFINKFKDTSNIDKTSLIMSSIKSNIILQLLMMIIHLILRLMLNIRKKEN